MAFCVCGGAMTACSFGMAPSTLNVLPVARVLSATPVATIMDNVPMVNVMPFGMCTTAFCPSLFAAHATPRP